MKNVTRILLVLPALLVLLLLGWGADRPAGVSARAAGMLAAAPPLERWNLGINSEGAPVYTAVVGRAVGAVGAFRSNRGASEIAMIFPAPASSRAVQSASFYLVSRDGTYAGTARLSLRVYTYAGALARTVSAAPIDLQAAPTGQWTAVALSATPANRVVQPGEFLAFHLELSAGAGGSLDARPMFDVTVQ